MERKSYIAPRIEIILMDTTSIMAGSGADSTSGPSLTETGESVDLGGTEPPTTGTASAARVAARGYVPWSDYEDDF